MIGIVGAGISGLVVAHHLHRLGVDHLVFEADPAAGGVLRTVRVEGSPLDLGPQRTRLTGEVAALVEALGLRDELVRADPALPLFVYREGSLRRVPFTLSEALRTDLLSWKGKLRVLLEPLTGGVRAGETVAGFLRRKFGEEAYLAFLGPLYGGLYASDPERMRAEDALARALEEGGVDGSLLTAFARRSRLRDGIPPGITFRDGMGTLADALASEAGDRLRLSTPVRSVVPAGDGWRVELEGGTVDAAHVVLSLPADRAAALLRHAEPDRAGALGGLTYNPLVVVHLRSDAPHEGLGYQVAFGEDLETRGVTWNTSAFGRDGIQTAYLGGMRNPELPSRPDAEIARLAADEFEEVTGHAARPLHVHRTRVPAWDRSWAALEGLRLPPGLHPCAAWWGRPGIPGRVREARLLAEALADGNPRTPSTAF